MNTRTDLHRFGRSRIDRRLAILKPWPATVVEDVDHLDLVRRHRRARPAAAAELRVGDVLDVQNL
jgi:hypothetical protein